MLHFLTLVALATFVTLSYSQDIRLPPSIVKQNEEKVITYIPEGHVKLDCEAKGFPKPSYKWMKNGDELNLNRPNIRSNTVTGMIEINPLYSLDEGYYQCVAENPNGKAKSNVIYLQRAMLGNFQNPDDVQAYTADQGKDFMIPCQAPKSIPDATFEWSTVEDKVDKYPMPVRFNSRINVDTSGNLYFTNVKPEDHHSGHLYKCSAYNPSKKETKHGSLSSLAVNQIVNAPTVQPSILFSTRSPDNIALIGSDITLTCIFRANPDATINWSRQGGSLPSGRFSYDATRMQMTIKSLVEEDEGTYKCTGSNSAGAVTEDIFLSVESVPVFTNSENQVANLNLTDGEDMTMECKAVAEPIASIDWFVNGDPINLGELGARYKLSPDNTVLTINSVCKDCASGSSDLKVFSCNASNFHGYDYISGYLNVLLPTLITLSPVDFTLEYGKEVVFGCEGTSDDSTPVTIDWLRNGEPIIYQPGRMQKNPDNSLSIFTENEDDQGASFAGEYACQVTNGYTTVTSDPVSLNIPEGVETTTVEALEVNPPPVVGASLSDIWWIFLIIAIIVLLLLLLLICCLCRQHMKGDTYPVDEKERANGNNPLKELADSGFQDYQRPEDEPMKGSRASLTESLNPDTDDEGSLAEYGDIDTGKFNEDGSFIGQYTGDKKKAPRNYYNNPQDSVV